MPEFRRAVQPIAGVLLLFVFACAWLWPTPLFTLANRTSDPRYVVVCYAMVVTLIATLCLLRSWKLRAVIALGSLVACWAVRILLA